MILMNLRPALFAAFSMILIVSCGVSPQLDRETTGTEAFSLFEKPLINVPLDDATQENYLDNLAKALSAYNSDPDDSDAIIWYG